MTFIKKKRGFFEKKIYIFFLNCPRLRHFLLLRKTFDTPNPHPFHPLPPRKIGLNVKKAVKSRHEITKTKRSDFTRRISGISAFRGIYTFEHEKHLKVDK